MGSRSMKNLCVGLNCIAPRWGAQNIDGHEPSPMGWAEESRAVGPKYQGLQILNGAKIKRPGNQKTFARLGE
jgi:hypothetical protein